MSQNLVSLSLSAGQLEEVQVALGVVEKNLAGLISLSVEQRLELRKMGPKSETFARKTHGVVVQNPEIMPRGFDIEAFTEDVVALDQLRPLFLRITALARRADDTEMALGSDIYKAALDGYRFAKAAGKGAALDELSELATVRFGRKGRPTEEANNPAA